jgi:hypothetical protein
MMSMKISIDHTYTMTSFVMEIDGQKYLVKEGYDPSDGESEVRYIDILDGNEVLTHTDEWLRLERLFQQNRQE